MYDPKFNAVYYSHHVRHRKTTYFVCSSRRNARYNDDVLIDSGTGDALWPSVMDVLTVQEPEPRRRLDEKYQDAATMARCHEDTGIEQHITILECGPMPNVMAALPNIGGALCLMPHSLADAHY